MRLTQYRVKCLIEQNAFEECSRQLNTIKEKQVNIPFLLIKINKIIIFVLCKDSITLFLMGKLEYLRGNHREALDILKNIPMNDDFM